MPQFTHVSAEDTRGSLEEAAEFAPVRKIYVVY